MFSALHMYRGQDLSHFRSSGGSCRSHILLWLSLAPLGLWLIAILGYLLFHRIDDAVTARRVDHLLDLRERVATALELSNRPPEDEIEERQQSDALEVAGRLHPRQLGWAFNRRALLHFALPLLIGAAMLFLPNPQDRVLAEQATLATAIQETIKTIQDQRAEIGRNQELSATDRERLLRELEQLERDLQANPRSREDALARLSTAEARLREQLNPQADARRAGLDQLAQRLAAAQQQPSTSRPEAGAAGEELRRPAKGSIN